MSDLNRGKLAAILETLIEDTKCALKAYPGASFKTQPEWIFTLHTLCDPLQGSETEWKDWREAAYALSINILCEYTDQEHPARANWPKASLQLDEWDQRDIFSYAGKDDALEKELFTSPLFHLGIDWLRWAARSGHMEAARASALHYIYGLFGDDPDNAFTLRQAAAPRSLINFRAFIWATHLQLLEQKCAIVKIDPLPLDSLGFPWAEEPPPTPAECTLGDYLVYRALEGVGEKVISADSPFWGFMAAGLVPAWSDWLTEWHASGHMLAGVQMALKILRKPYDPCPGIKDSWKTWCIRAVRYIEKTLYKGKPPCLGMPKCAVIDVYFMFAEAKLWVTLRRRITRLLAKIERLEREGRIAYRREAVRVRQQAREWLQAYDYSSDNQLADVVETAEAWTILEYYEHAQGFWDLILKSWVIANIDPLEYETVVTAARRSPPGRVIAFWLRADDNQQRNFPRVAACVTDGWLSYCLSHRLSERNRNDDLSKAEKSYILQILCFFSQADDIVHRSLFMSVLAQRFSPRTERAVSEELIILQSICVSLEKLVEVARAKAYMPNAPRVRFLQQRVIGNLCKQDKVLKDKIST